MNITNQTSISNTTAFRAVQPEIMKNIKSFRPEIRENILKHYDVLERSEVVDLAYNRKGKMVLRTKKDLSSFCKGDVGIPKSTEISTYEFNFIDGSKLNFINVGNKTNKYSTRNLVLDFGLPKYALEWEELMMNESGEFTNFLPQFGALIDMAYRLKEHLEQIKNIAQETFHS